MGSIVNILSCLMVHSIELFPIRSTSFLVAFSINSYSIANDKERSNWLEIISSHDVNTMYMYLPSDINEHSKLWLSACQMSGEIVIGLSPCSLG